ncbi:hypothetical protein [Flavobacterium aurantiibacter]|uniref:DUF4276 domain-containing protein n=1 Tax=Flavobacterium aurantiibacter TaxID=2023067 RepID=A0A255ZLF9_9FLAO|nr:hypothetical protein [Flavobacterium aurantiibacter]OYQ42261.1 hypothetical protein CHX27_12215 [Flavobacterium aurantiibacter]
MAVIGVECNADRYFFAKLLGNKGLIRKEKNESEVIKGIVQRSKDSFRIGIIDEDKNKRIPADFKEIYKDANSRCFKREEKFQFLFLIGPRQFEHWINSFLIKRNKDVSAFEFESFEEFMQKSKSVTPENDSRFAELIDYVLEEHASFDNHVLKVKLQIEYLLEKKFEFEIKEFVKI